MDNNRDEASEPSPASKPEPLNSCRSTTKSYNHERVESRVEANRVKVLAYDNNKNTAFVFFTTDLVTCRWLLPNTEPQKIT